MNSILENNLGDIIQFRRYLHENPELSFKEYNTTKILKEKLSNTPFKFYELSDKTGLIGHLVKNPTFKTVAIRADIDALPIEETTGLPFTSKNEGVMHACGHDIHTSILYGYCKVIAEMYDQIKYNLVVIFQPAEEIMGGAKYIKEEIKNLNIPIDEIIAYHTWPFLEEGKVGYRKGDMMAGAMNFHVEIKASGGHAAHPHTTADPVFLSTNMINFFQSIVSRFNNPVKPLVITVGSIHGGNKANVISSSCEFSGTMRSFSKESLGKAKKIIEDYVYNISEMSGATCEIEFDNYCPPVINNHDIVDEFVDSSPNDLMSELHEPSMGSEDFAFYLEEYKGALFRVGTRIESEEKSKLGLHNPSIIFSEKSIQAGIQALLNFTTEQ